MALYNRSLRWMGEHLPSLLKLCNSLVTRVGMHVLFLKRHLLQVKIFHSLRAMDNLCLWRCLRYHISGSPKPLVKKKTVGWWLEILTRSREPRETHSDAFLFETFCFFFSVFCKIKDASESAIRFETAQYWRWHFFNAFLVLNPAHVSKNSTLSDGLFENDLCFRVTTLDNSSGILRPDRETDFSQSKLISGRNLKRSLSQILPWTIVTIDDQ